MSYLVPIYLDGLKFTLLATCSQLHNSLMPFHDRNFTFRALFEHPGVKCWEHPLCNYKVLDDRVLTV